MRLSPRAFLAPCLCVLSCGQPAPDGSPDVGEEAPVAAPLDVIRVGDEPIQVEQVSFSGSGDRAPDRFPGTECRGNLPQAPQHTLAVVERAAVELAVASQADTTLVVTGGLAPACSDDVDDFNPRLALVLEPGTYSVFVGQFTPLEPPTPYTLTVVAAPRADNPEGSGEGTGEGFGPSEGSY